MYLRLLTGEDSATIKGQTTLLNLGVGRMETEKLKQSYKDMLVRAGVDFHRAEQAVKNLTWEELHLIGEIWPEWAAAFAQTQNELNLLPLPVSWEFSDLSSHG